MKKTLVLILMITLSSTVFAQRFAYVDTDYILENIPEYTSAQKKLESYTKEVRAEIQNRIEELDKMYKEYQAEKVLLPDSEKKKREESIMKKEEDLNTFKQDKLGTEGELYEMRKKLVKPIQDKVFDAIQQIAKDESLDFVLDKSGSTTMLYTNAKYDRSKEVLDILGISMNNSESNN